MGKNRFGREDSGTQVQKSGRQLDGGGGGGGGVCLELQRVKMACEQFK